MSDNDIFAFDATKCNKLNKDARTEFNKCETENRN